MPSTLDESRLKIPRFALSRAPHPEIASAEVCMYTELFRRLSSAGASLTAPPEHTVCCWSCSWNHQVTWSNHPLQLSSLLVRKQRFHQAPSGGLSRVQNYLQRMAQLQPRRRRLQPRLLKCPDCFRNWYIRKPGKETSILGVTSLLYLDVDVLVKSNHPANTSRCSSRIGTISLWRMLELRSPQGVVYRPSIVRRRKRNTAHKQTSRQGCFEAESVPKNFSLTISNSCRYSLRWSLTGLCLTSSM